MTKTLISVVIPTHNSEKTIEKCLSSLLRQSFPKRKYEIIVIDDSHDNTPTIVKKFPVKLIRKRKISITKARNLGVKSSKGKIIAFIDSDCVAEKKWLEKIANNFLNKNLYVISGVIKTYNKENYLAKFIGYEKEYRYEKIPNLKNSLLFGTFNCACRKEVFKEVKFNEKIEQPGVEDVIFGFEASKLFKIEFNKEIKVFHINPTSLTAYLKKQYNKAYWHFIILKKYFKETMSCKYVDFFTVIQIPLTLLLFLLLLLNPFSLIFTIPAILICNIPFLSFLYKKESLSFLFKSFYRIFARNIAWLFGCLIGFVHFLFKRHNFDFILSNKD